MSHSTGTAQMSGTTLYYPYIHPRRIDHLKAALIYWDRVRRIVPPDLSYNGHIPNDGEECRLLAENALLVSTSPQPYVAAAAELFFRHLEPSNERFVIDIDTARKMACEHRGIHLEKVAHPVLCKLQELGFAHAFGEWVSMHDEVAGFYMFCLASETARAMSVPMFTDSKSESEFGQALLFSSQKQADVSAHLLRLGIALPSPSQLADIPMKTLVAFSKKRATERQAFRAAIEGILSAAASVNKDPHAIDDHFGAEKMRIGQAVEDLRRTLDEIRIGAISSAAQITVPAGVAAGVALLPISQIASAALAAAGITIGLISCFGKTRGKLRQARASSPYHYLAGIESDLAITALC